MALSNQVFAEDANGQLVCYVKQKMFKLKEHVTVFADQQMQQPLCDIKADKVIDFSAKYTFTGADGSILGHVRRQGMRSIWRAHYEILDPNENLVMEIKEEYPWKKFWDGMLGELPIIGMFSGFFIHPSYLVSNTTGEPVFRLTKKAAFFEGLFQIDELKDMQEADDMRALLSLLMMIMLERRRG